MKRLHLFVLKSFLGPFFLTFFICVFVLLMQFLWKYIDELAGKGLEFGILVELLFYATLTLVPMAFPLAILLASIMTFGDLGENYELVAMKASGISLARIMRPLIFFAIGLCFFAFYFANNILPQTNLMYIELMRSVRQQKPEMIIKEGVFSNEIDGFTINVGKKSSKSNMFYDIHIYDHRRNLGNISLTTADSGYMEISEDKKFMVMTLFDGQNYEDDVSQKSKNYPFRRDIFKKQVIHAPLTGFDFKHPGDNTSRQNSMLTLSQLGKLVDSLYVQYNYYVKGLVASIYYNDILRKSIQSLSEPVDSLRKYEEFSWDQKSDFMELFDEMDLSQQISSVNSALERARSNKQTIDSNTSMIYMYKKNINYYDLERFKKFFWSFACVIFFFIGAPLGAIIRKGGLGMPVVVSILLFIAYYVVTIIGEKFAREDVWTMASGAWFSTLVFLPIGLFLTYKSVNDSGLLSMETYQNLLKRLFALFHFKKEKEVF